MHNAKKIILILTALLWMIHPAIAATTDNAAKTQTTAQSHSKISSKKSHHKCKRKHKKTRHHSSSAPAVAETATAPVLTNLVQTTAIQKQPESSTESKSESASAGFSGLSSSGFAASAAPTTFFSTPPPAPTSFASIEQRLVDFVYNSVTNLRYSAYKLGGTRVDTSHGIYIVDCSGYVDHTLHAVFPNAYSSLVSWSGTAKPNTQHYYDFFTDLSEDPNQNWSKVDNIEQLQPGDILVFRYKNTHGHSAGGHVMVVMNKPVRDEDAFLVSVADSAPAGHSQDTRLPHVSGVGVGTLLLKANPKTGRPSAFAWKVGSRWEKNVKFAMARPVAIDS